MRTFRSITKKEWAETPREYKSIIEGQRYKLFLTNKGTSLVPVRIQQKKQEYDPIGHRELYLFIENDEPTYKRESYLKKNYVKKLASGKYNPQLARRGFMNLIVVPSARKYDKDFGSGYGSNFSKAVREGVAKQRERSFFREYRYGELPQEWIPKKYQQKKFIPKIPW